MDAESQLLADKDAEIERLLLKHAKEENVFLTSLEAAATEIARLKEALHEAGARNAKLVLQLREKDLLITELCDALETSASHDTDWARQSNHLEIAHRAREATK